MGREQLDDQWQLRVCDADGKTVGAGVLLGDGYVLTCAHVVRDAGVSTGGPSGLDARLRVESVVCRPRWSRPARVIPGCWVSRRETRRGDVALLALDEPVTSGKGARLRRAPVRGVAVRVHGFFDPGIIGALAECRLVGASYDGEWVEMHVASQHRGQWVTHGFSGAGVAEESSGDVVGIVVAVREDGSSVNAWMMPVETIVDYLPAIAPFADGGRTSDLTGFPHREHGTPESAVDVALRQEIGRLFTGVWSGTAVITGGAPDSGSSWLARLVATADPAARRRISDVTIAEAPHGAVLGVGAIDLAVDAAGRSVREIRHRIAERFGVPSGDSAELVGWLLHRQPPPALVIDRVDSAADTRELIRDLLAPLAEEARRRGVRLVLGFTGQPPEGLPHEISLGPEPLTGPARGPADPAVIRRHLANLAAAEDRLAPLHAHVKSRVAGVPGLPPCRAPRLRVRYAVSAGEPPARELAVVGDHAKAALAELERMSDQLEDLKREFDDLGMTLNLYHMRAKRYFGAEDRQLSEPYGRARAALRAGPCDLGAARALVGEYVDAVQRRIGGPGGRIP